MSGETLLEVRDLSVSFKLSRSLFARGRRLRAVDGVSFDLAPGETLGLVGESGSGKSTTGRAILRLIEPDAGTVRLDGENVLELNRRELNRARRDMQMVFQDPYSSLNPSVDIATSVGEPLEVHLGMRRRERERRVAELLELVGLRPEHLHRYPYEFSGGQRQRIAIARAIALHPRLVICDEAVSALDVSTQNQIIDLLEDLRDRYAVAFIFIAHDLSVVRHLAHRVAVMYLGEIVEIGPVERIFEEPAHPYTRALLSAVPLPNPRLERARERIVLQGDLPDPSQPPPGCRFHTRCPWVMEICRHEVPPTVEIDGGGTAACHLHTIGQSIDPGGVSTLTPDRWPARDRAAGVPADRDRLDQPR